MWFALHVDLSHDLDSKFICVILIYHFRFLSGSCSETKNSINLKPDLTILCPLFNIKDKILPTLCNCIKPQINFLFWSFKVESFYVPIEICQVPCWWKLFYQFWFDGIFLGMFGSNCGLALNKMFSLRHVACCWKLFSCVWIKLWLIEIFFKIWIGL